MRIPGLGDTTSRYNKCLDYHWFTPEYKFRQPSNNRHVNIITSKYILTITKSTCDFCRERKPGFYLNANIGRYIFTEKTSVRETWVLTNPLSCGLVQIVIQRINNPELKQITKKR